jgi:hypothetical protein
MQTDRTTKLLLLLIAAGLWASVFKPAAMQPAVAAVVGSPVALNEMGGVKVLVRFQDGKAYLGAVDPSTRSWSPLALPK